MNTEWSNTTKHIVGTGLIIFGVYILYLSRSVLALVIIAALIAFLLMPAVDFCIIVSDFLVLLQC